MHIKIHTAALPDAQATITDSAAKLVRMGFNPSTLHTVDTLKAIAAAFVSECEAIRDAQGPGAREAAIAITDMQKTSMMAVAAATAHLG
jgi:hypothetical protein